MLNKIQKYISETIFKSLQDVRVLGLVVFGVIVLLVTWSGVGSVETNYNLQKQITQLQQENDLANLQNKNLQLQNQYYNTNEYIELQARQLLGKGASGEKLVLVPKTVAIANTVNIPEDKTISVTPPPLKPKYQSNFEAWMNFFFHRNS